MPYVAIKCILNEINEKLSLFPPQRQGKSILEPREFSFNEF
jgi:hypothetical protein